MLTVVTLWSSGEFLEKIFHTSVEIFYYFDKFTINFKRSDCIFIDHTYIQIDRPTVFPRKFFVC